MNELITPLILTFNEEANIARTLAALQGARTIVVVDSMSSDGTVGVALAHPGVKVVQRVFDDHASQWNFGLGQVTTPWVLALDADYVLSEELRAELESFYPDDGVQGYRANFRYCMNGVPLRGSLYPSHTVLFRRGKASFVQDGHTQRLSLAGETRELKAVIMHDDRKPLTSWLRAQSRYAHLEIEKLFSEPVSQRRVDRVRRLGWLMPFLTPLYCLFGRGLIMDGLRGVNYTLQRTYAETLLALLVLEHRARRTSKGAPKLP